MTFLLCPGCGTRNQDTCGPDGDLGSVRCASCGRRDLQRCVPSRVGPMWISALVGGLIALLCAGPAAVPIGVLFGYMRWRSLDNAGQPK